MLIYFTPLPLVKHLQFFSHLSCMNIIRLASLTLTWLFTPCHALRLRMLVTTTSTCIFCFWFGLSFECLLFYLRESPLAQSWPTTWITQFFYLKGNSSIGRTNLGISFSRSLWVIAHFFFIIYMVDLGCFLAL